MTLPRFPVCHEAAAKEEPGQGLLVRCCGAYGLMRVTTVRTT